MLQNYPPRILRFFKAADIYTDEQVLLNLDRLEELGLRSTDARRVRAKVAAIAVQGNSSRPVDGEREAVGGAVPELPALTDGGVQFGGAELWTVRQVAGFLQLHRRTVANWCISGRIKAVKLGDDWRIAGSEVMRLANGGAHDAVERIDVDV